MSILKLGDIIHGYRSYGGSGHNLGLFTVTNIGQKFVSMIEIETEIVGDEKSYSDPAYSESSVKEKAVIPIRMKVNVKPQRFSHNKYSLDNVAIVDDGGSMCNKVYRLLKPNEKGEYEYIASRTHYG